MNTCYYACYLNIIIITQILLAIQMSCIHIQLTKPRVGDVTIRHAVELILFFQTIHRMAIME